jgi:hypothetical protein
MSAKIASVPITLPRIRFQDFSALACAPRFRAWTAGDARCAGHGVESYLWVESLYTGQGPWFLLGLHEGRSEEHVHYAGPVALARVVKHVRVPALAMGLVGVDLFAEKVVDYLDLSGSARPI